MSFSYSKKSFGWMFLLAFVLEEGRAQQPKFLPLQPHKVQWANAVIKNALKTKDTIQLAEGYYLYGKIYEASGDYLTAKRYFMRSLRIQEKRGDSEELARLYTRLSGLGFTFYNYADALRYAQLSLAVAQRMGSDKALLRAYAQMRGIHETDWTRMEGKSNKNAPKPNYDSVLYYLRKIEPLARRSPDPLELATVNNYLGNELRRRNDPTAIVYIENVLKIYTKQKKTADQVGAMVYLADTYLQFGQHQQAKHLLAKATQLRGTMPSPNEQGLQSAFEVTYVHYYQAIGDWKRAFEHVEKLHELERNRFLADREGAASRLSVEYETEKKEAQLKSQQKELALSNENQNIQRRFLIAISVLLVGAVLATVAFYRLYRKNQRISRQNTELVHEQNHRVKNNLQLVSSLLTLQSNRLTDAAAKNAVEDTQLRIEVMVILQRKLYDGDHLTSVYLLEFMQELVEIVLQTFSYEHVQVIYDISPALEVSIDHALRIGFIVNELATNACKYAFPDHPNPKFKVACSTQGDVFELKAADNGKGFQLPKAADGSKNKSFGMQLIQLQVKQLDGTYRFDTTQGTAFQMQFKV
jgi:two-component sensor histidine kinase